MDIAIPVDWNLWKDRKIVTIREACFLSVGICPMNYKKLAFIQVDKNIKFKDAYTFKKAIDSEIRKRYTSIDENMPILGGNFPLLKKDIIYYIVCALVNNLPGVAANFKSDFFMGRESLVRLSEFGAWAKSMGWDLPPEFPAGTSTDAHQQDTVTVTALKDILAAIKTSKSESAKKMLKAAQAFHDDNGRYPEGRELFSMGKDAHGYDDWETFRKTFVRYFSEAG